MADNRAHRTRMADVPGPCLDPDDTEYADGSPGYSSELRSALDGHNYSARHSAEERVMKRKERRYSDYETAHYYAMRRLSGQDNIRNIRIDKSNNEWILSWFERNESLPDSFNAFWENHFRDVSRAEMRNDPGFT